MAAIVYLLCTLTSILCAFLLFRAYRRTGARLLFLTCVGFCGIALNNIILFVDVIVLPDVTYILDWRSLPAVVCLGIMIYGLIMEEV